MHSFNAWRFTAIIAGLLLALTATPATVQAKITDKDLQVVFRALGFMQPKPSGTLKGAIVHDPSKSASQSEAKQLQNLMKGGYSAKGVTLTPVMVTTDNLDQLAKYDVAFVTKNLKAQYSQINTLAQNNNIFTVSTDKQCVEDGACVMFVQSSPSVQIIVNSSVAKNASISFSSAFSMMIDEI